MTVRIAPFPALAAVVALAAAPAPAHPAGAAAPLAFKLYLEEPGVYAVSYESLAAAGLAGTPKSAGIGLANAGRPVPVWIEDGGDGQFGPGDRLEFVGDRLAGEGSWYDEHSNLNVYVLSWNGERPARMHAPAAAPPPAFSAVRDAGYTTRRHLERDLLLLRFPSQPGQPAQASGAQELWYWAKLTQIDPQPFAEKIALPDLATTSGRPVRLSVHLRGWSQPAKKPEGMADHRVEVSVGGKVVGRGEWDNAAGNKRIDVELPAALLSAGENEVAIRVPPRPVPGTQDSLIDVVMLNWIEVAYPRTAAVGPEQARLELPAPAPAMLSIQPAAATGPGTGGLTVYGEAGTRLTLAAAGAGASTFRAPAGERALWAVPNGRLRAPLAVEADHPSALAGARRADYIVIAHPRLLEAIRPLADFHRKRGLAVEVVDIRDVYDEFNHSILHPRAIRDFLRHAYRDWQPPQPRFVLLVGDASWDPKNARAQQGADFPDAAFAPGQGTAFAKITSTPYSEQGALDHRNLVPAWNYGTFDGHAAGDNWFADVEGDDLKPEMAIGRFPVVEPDEVAAIVEKTIRYAASPEPGPWRRDVLWITNEDAVLQTWSDELASELGARGFSGRKVYPAPETAAGAAHDQEALLRALDGGELLVHFMGHGGRFIWRTGPPDWTKHRDLFNLDDIDKLKPSGRLPVVLSMTCYSAPFDHPTADSIGEKFLRVADKGAVAVLAASWRNSPYKQMSDQVLQELLLPGSTLGEALMRTKRKSPDVEFVKQYNLLGDPALVLPLPQLALDLSPSGTPGGPPEVAVRMKGAERFAGRAVVDWIDAAGKVVQTDELPVAGGEFRATYRGPAERMAEVQAARVYAWDPKGGMDGAGEVRMTRTVAPPPTEATRP